MDFLLYAILIGLAAAITPIWLIPWLARRVAPAYLPSTGNRALIFLAATASGAILSILTSPLRMEGDSLAGMVLAGLLIAMTGGCLVMAICWGLVASLASLERWSNNIPTTPEHAPRPLSRRQDRWVQIIGCALVTALYVSATAVIIGSTSWKIGG